MRKVKFAHILLVMFMLLNITSIAGAEGYKSYISVKDQNIRSQNIDYASPVQFVPRESELVYKGETTTNGYFNVEYRGKVGYIHRGDLTSKKNYTNDNKNIQNVKITKVSGRYVVVKDELLRSGDTEHHSSVTLIPAGSEVESVGITSSDYFRVKYEDKQGYIHRSDLTSHKNYHSTDKTLINAKFVNKNKKGCI